MHTTGLLQQRYNRKFRIPYIHDLYGPPMLGTSQA